MSVFFIVPHSSGTQINNTTGETEKLSKYGTGWILFKFGKVLSMIGILVSLLGIAASTALIILHTRPGYNFSHSGYMLDYGFIGILLVTCILLLMTCVLLLEYTGDSNLDGMEEIIKNYCYILEGVRIVLFVLTFGAHLFLFMTFMYDQLFWQMIVSGAYLALAFATWMMYGIRKSQRKKLFVEACMIYHIFVFIIIVGVFIFTYALSIIQQRRQA